MLVVYVYHVWTNHNDNVEFRSISNNKITNFVNNEPITIMDKSWNTDQSNLVDCYFIFVWIDYLNFVTFYQFFVKSLKSNLMIIIWINNKINFVDNQWTKVNYALVREFHNVFYSILKYVITVSKICNNKYVSKITHSKL